MTAPVPRRAAASHVGRPLRVALAVTLVALFALATVDTVRAVGGDPGRPDIDDFHAFVLAGRLAWDGHLADAYRAAAMVPLEGALGGRPVDPGSGYMPYGYPPLFGLLLAPLAPLPLAAAFALFVGTTLLGFLTVLRRLAGPWFWTVLLTTAPAALIDIRIGQNGFLTAALAGSAALLAVARRSVGAGLAAGLLAALKPHLAVGVLLLFLLRRDGRALGAAGLSAAALSALAVALLGADAVPAFLAGLSDMGHFLAEGRFPLYRMASPAAALLALGVPAGPALALHTAVAAVALAAAAAVVLRLRDDRAAAGVLLIATAFASPYLYDYDLTVVGTGLGLALPALAVALPGRRLDLLLAGFAAAAGAGLVQIPLVGGVPGRGWPLGAPLLLCCFAVVLVALRRAPGTERSPLACEVP